MSEKLKIELSSPFGPTLLKAKLPEELIKDLNTDCDEIVAKKRSHSHDFCSISIIQK